MLPRVAAVTMAYNEPVFLPLWTRHYARQVGADHCYVIDHGSTDVVEVPPGINVLRLPRSPHDDPRRALFISAFVEALLEYYDWVVHTDVDEIVLADPAGHADLPSFCADVPADSVTAIGLDVQHVPLEEAALRPGVPIGAQRGWARFTSAMCKPVLTRRPLVWSPGFHCADAALAFSSLYLFHLRWSDYATALARLEKTRSMPWGGEAYGAHQRISDAEFAAMFDGMAAFPKRVDVEFDASRAPLSDWLGRLRASTVGREDSVYTVDLHLNAAELWAIPARFRARL